MSGFNEKIAKVIDPVLENPTQDWRELMAKFRVSAHEMQKTLELSPSDLRSHAEIALNDYRKEVRIAATGWKVRTKDRQGMPTVDEWEHIFWARPIVRDHKLLPAAIDYLVRSKRPLLALEIVNGEPQGSAPYDSAIFLLAVLDKCDALTAIQLSNVHLSSNSKQVRAAAWFTRGNAFVKLLPHVEAVNAYKEALNAYSKAISELPTKAAPYSSAGRLLYNLTKYDEGELLLRRGIELCGEDADLLNNLGCCLYQKGDAIDAEMCFVRALELEPNHAEAMKNLAEITAKIKRRRS